MDNCSESCRFETSEILGAFMASTPVLFDSWRLCSAANSAGNIQTELSGRIWYVAFPALQIPPSADLVPLEAAGEGLFSAFSRTSQAEEPPPMVDAAMLRLFSSSFPLIQPQIRAGMEGSKLVVITGHSVGGAVASLTALWLLSYLQSLLPSSFHVLCITFGSPLLGNQYLSRAIFRLRLDRNFCHLASKHDIIPRLLFAPLSPEIAQFISAFLQFRGDRPLLLSDQHKASVLNFVLACMEDGSTRSGFWPFGSYLFCSEEGAICIDNADSVTRMMLLMLRTGTPDSCIEDHLKYGQYVGILSWQFLKARSFRGRNLSESSYDTGVALALESMGVSHEDPVAAAAKQCIEMARRVGRAPILRSAEVANELASVLPCRLEIQWYKERCDASEEQLGYYDFFKRGSMRRDYNINLSRLKLGQFWDRVIKMIESNEVPFNFHWRGKWVYAAQFYRLLAEPLDIADFYKKKKPEEKGRHYMKHGRPRRHEIFDKWWRENPDKVRENFKRSRFASATQDSCFWAKLEEAKECLDDIRTESDMHRRALLWENVTTFEKYANALVEKKDVSIDVLARNSSYSLWVAALRNFKSQTSTESPMVDDVQMDS